jgi:hypothetical protein
MTANGLLIVAILSPKHEIQAKHPAGINSKQSPMIKFQMFETKKRHLDFGNSNLFRVGPRQTLRPIFGFFNHLFDSTHAEMGKSRFWNKGGENHG